MSVFFRHCPTAGSASGLPPLGHCFVVGARHQLRALHVGGLARLCRAGSPKLWTVVPPQDNWIFFSQLSPHRTTGNCFSRLSAWTTSTFFLLGRIHLGAGSAGLLCRAGGAAGGFSSRVRRSATGVSRWPWPGNLKCTIWSYTAAEQSTCEFEGAHRLSSFSKVHQDLSECQTYHHQRI